MRPCAVVEVYTSRRGYLARMAAGLSRPAFLAAASLARVRPPFTEPKLVAAIDGFLAGSYKSTSGSTGRRAFSAPSTNLLVLPPC